MQFTTKFFNIHTSDDQERTFILTNETQVTPLMGLCLENFFKNLNPACEAKDFQVTRKSPTWEGCRYDIRFTYVDPKSKRVRKSVHKYTINPITKELAWN